jgi:hypothetical protein
MSSNPRAFIGVVSVDRRRTLSDRLEIDPCTVVGNFDNYGLTNGRSREPDSSLRRLPCRDALIDGFDAVTNGIPDEMQDRIHHPLDEELVDLRVLTDHLQMNALADIASEVADHERHAAKDLAHRDETNAHDRIAEVAQLTLHQRLVLLQQAELARWHVALHPLERVVEPRPGDHEIPGQSHQVVQAREIDANEVRRSAGRNLPGARSGRRLHGPGGFRDH